MFVSALNGWPPLRHRPVVVRLDARSHMLEPVTLRPWLPRCSACHRRGRMSRHQCRPVVSAVSSVMPSAVGGCTCGGVRPAATLVVATIRWPGTPPRTGEKVGIRSSDRSSRARTSSGTTRATITTRVLNLPHRNVILWIRRSPVPVNGCRATGPTCSDVDEPTIQRRDRG
jgi:hypothetical protein